MAPLQLAWSAEQIAARVTELGRQIAGRHPAGAERAPVLITVLKGGMIFLADLVRAIPLACEVDFLGVRPLDPAARSESQHVALTKDIETDISGRHVVLVEDVVDSGLTLSYLLRVLATRDPASLRACVLLDRPGRRVASLPLEHVGFEIGTARLVGYGLDLGGWFRNCADLWEVRDQSAVLANPGSALEHVRGQRRSHDAALRLD